MSQPEQNINSAYLKEIEKETDRGAVLLSASLIDHLLGDIIKAFLIERPQTKALFSGPNSPLGSFSNRISFAYALGLISDDEHHDYQIIRQIRNKFAHRIDLNLSLENTDIAQQISILKNAIFTGEDRPNPKRFQFDFMMAVLLVRLDNRVQEVGINRLVQKQWNTLSDFQYRFRVDESDDNSDWQDIPSF